MSRKTKLADRLLTLPTDFTWDEMVTLLAGCGYREQHPAKTGGSRRKFVNGEKHVIVLHKPRPGKIVKQYALTQVINSLKKE
jgi:hypothetical protein